MSMRRGQRTGAVILLTIALVGCGSDGLDDLREFAKSAHADKKPRIEPPPEIKTHEVFAYKPDTLPDPFAAQNINPRAPRPAAGRVSS